MPSDETSNVESATFTALTFFDIEFWVFAALAVFIAIFLSSVELLTRYRSRSFREIFFSKHYLWFAVLNAVFCFLVYWSLPYLSKLVVSAEFDAAVDQGLVRAITAGLGYLIIARMSILDITSKDGTTYGVGFDGIYHACAEYLLDHHRRQMRKQMRDDFAKVFDPSSSKERAVFKGAAMIVMAGLESTEERAVFNDRLDLADSNFPQDDRVAEYSFTVYQLIRDFTTGAAEAEVQIQQKRAEPTVASDAETPKPPGS